MEGHGIFILMDRSNVNNQVDNTSTAKREQSKENGIRNGASLYQDVYRNAKALNSYL